MSVEQLPTQPPAQPRSRSEASFPGYPLADAIEVPRVIHMRGGGTASPEHLAAFLNYKGTNNGAYLTKVGAARAFGFINKSGNVFVPTPLAQRILSPVYPHEAKQALVEAFLNVELFKRVYEDFKGKDLPPEFGLKNALRTTYGVVPARVDLAYRSLMESADTAGFFSTKLGARTHLIPPMIQPVMTPAVAAVVIDAPRPHSFGGGGDEPPPPPPPPQSAGAGLSDVKARYLETLLKAFEAKSASGELDEQLMARIERLLGMEGPT